MYRAVKTEITNGKSRFMYRYNPALLDSLKAPELLNLLSSSTERTFVDMAMQEDVTGTRRSAKFIQTGTVETSSLPPSISSANH